MKTTGERLLYLINTQDVSMSKFCEENGLNYQSINPICNNKRELGINILNDLVKIFPNLNVNWLLYGKGNINIIKYDDTNEVMLLKEPSENSTIDVVEKVFLNYLDKKNVRNKILEIVNDEKN